MKRKAGGNTEVEVEIGPLGLQGDLYIPAAERSGFVVFSHGSGSGRHSPRNRYVAQILQQAGFGTLLMDLLTVQEEEEESVTGHLRFNIELLAGRLLQATDWLDQYCRSAPELAREARIGYFGASTGAAAALVAASERRLQVRAVVSRGGRPDLAGAALYRVKAPTLLIVGGDDKLVIPLNQEALEKIAAQKKELAIVPGATHLFEEPGTLEEAAHLARDWFEAYLHEGSIT